MTNSKEEQFTHRQLAVACFNGVWDLLDKQGRTEIEDEEMLNKAHASLYHWTKVENHSPTNLSVGYWLLARVYAMLELGERALHYAEKCLSISIDNNLEPFYVAYAYEAKARAYAVLKKEQEMRAQKMNGQEVKERIENEEFKLLITKDLQTIFINN
jgi:hypothetical protein